jgi:hypothetical protein
MSLVNSTGTTTIWTRTILWWLRPAVAEEPVVEWLLRQHHRVTLLSTSSNREWVASRRPLRRPTTRAVMFLIHLTWRATYLVTWRWLCPSCRPGPSRSQWTIKPTPTASLTPLTRRANRPVLSPIRSKLKFESPDQGGVTNNFLFFIFYVSLPPTYTHYIFLIPGEWFQTNVVHVLHLRISFPLLFPFF